MLQTMSEVFQRVCGTNKSTLIEINGEPDHVHLMIDLHPNNNISQLVASLKGASSRILRKKFEEEVAQVYFGKGLMTPFKGIMTDAEIVAVAKYIEKTFR